MPAMIAALVPLDNDRLFALFSRSIGLTNSRPTSSAENNSMSNQIAPAGRAGGSTY
ncbi:MAG: hypothetical protein ABI831_18275 [Betaproteobacteria bacterium]